MRINNVASDLQDLSEEIGRIIFDCSNGVQMRT